MVPHLDYIAQNATELLAVNAYLHHYTAHGLERESMIDALTLVEQTIADYRVNLT